MGDNDLSNLATDDIVQRVSNLARSGWMEPGRTVSSLQFEPPATRKVHSVALMFHSLGIGGGERVTRYLATLLSRIGYEVIVIVESDEGIHDLVSELPQRVPIEKVPNAAELSGDTYCERCAQLNRVLANHRVDALVFCHWFMRSIPFDILLARLMGIKVLLYIQTSFTQFFLDSDLPSDYLDIPLSYSLAHGVVCLSEVDRLFWSNFSSSSHQTLNPLTLAPALKGPTLGGHNIIWPARLHSDKCPERVIPVMRHLKDLVSDAKLYMVGPVDENTKASLLSSARIAHVEDRIIICGAQPEEDMRAWYERADAFLLTSRREGWSLALGEALAVGLPCVIYELPNLTLSRCQAVISVPQDDSLAMAQALARVLTDKSYAQQLSRTGRQFTRKLSNYDYEGFWRHVLDSPQESSDGFLARIGNLTETEFKTSQSANLSETRSILWSELFSAYQFHVKAIEQRIYSDAVSHDVLVRENENLSSDLARIRQSASYRLGNILISPLRLARDALRSVLDHLQNLK